MTDLAEKFAAARLEQKLKEDSYSAGIRHAISVSVVALRKAAMEEPTIDGRNALASAAAGFQALLDAADVAAAAEIAEEDEVLEGEVV